MRQDRPLTVPEAAELLGVLPERVRVLIRRGQLPAERAHGVWLVDSEAVARRGLTVELGITGASVRPWSPMVAWAAMRSLDGDDALLDALDRKTRHRLRSRLAVASPARSLSAVRDRAALVRVSVHASRVEGLRALVVPSGIAGAGLHGHGLSGDTRVDGYLTSDTLEQARTRLGVRDTPSGAHLLRVVTDGRLIDGLTVAPRLAVATDLVDHAAHDGSIDSRVVDTIRNLLDGIARTGAPRATAA